MSSPFPFVYVLLPLFPVSSISVSALPPLVPSVLQALVRELNGCLYRYSSTEAPPPPFPLACCVTRDTFRHKTAASRSSQRVVLCYGDLFSSLFLSGGFFPHLHITSRGPAAFMPSVWPFQCSSTLTKAGQSGPALVTLVFLNTEKKLS